MVGHDLGEWNFLRDWDIRRESATEMDRSARDVQGWALGYHSTERTTTHPDEKMRYEATLWRWTVLAVPDTP